MMQSINDLIMRISYLHFITRFDKNDAMVLGIEILVIAVFLKHLSFVHFDQHARSMI